VACVGLILLGLVFWIPPFVGLFAALVDLVLGALSFLVKVIAAAFDPSRPIPHLILSRDPFFVFRFYFAELPAVAGFVAAWLWALVTALLVRWAGFSELVKTWCDQLGLPAQSVRKWIEFSSRYDPVSCGPLLAECADDFEEVINGWFLFAEHMRYRRNRLILLRLLCEIGEVGGQPLSPEAASAAADLEAAERRRQRRWRYALGGQLAIGYFALVAAIGLIAIVLEGF
jgi:hypothetical protein